MRSCIFSIITPVFSVTWFFRNHSNMMVCCSRNISDYYQWWKQLCCWIFLWKLWYFAIFQDCLMNRKFKRTAVIWNKRSFVKLWMSLLSLWINLMHPCWIKALIYFKTNVQTPKFAGKLYIHSKEKLRVVICSIQRLIFSIYTVCTLLTQFYSHLLSWFVTITTAL